MGKKDTKVEKIKKVKIKDEKKSFLSFQQTAPAILCLIVVRIIFELILRYDREK